MHLNKLEYLSKNTLACLSLSDYMKDYKKEYRNFSFPVPERFSFPIDVFDKWDNRLALFWTDGIEEKNSLLKN